MAPNIAKPTTKPSALLTPKTRFLNRRSGRIGSSARRSTATNSASRTTPATPKVTICGDAHAYVVPPRLVISTRQVVPAATSVAPR